ncbi:MAG TPA: hypothetical protein VK066_20035 [Chloroflexota bacterium]|nr:hypothetical protein [Chloroflexota bacterium]
MATKQPHLLDVDEAELADLEQRVLVTRRFLNHQERELKAAKERHKAAEAAYEQALAAWGHALYGDDWDGTGLPPTDAAAAPDGEEPPARSHGAVIDGQAVVVADR